MPELQLNRNYPEAYDNLVELGENDYPGRIAMMGLSATGDLAIQAYAIMGRSTSSRTRIFTDEGAGSVRTTAPGKTQEEMAATENAELIYYQASAAGEGVYVISNGAQTDSVYKGILRGYTLGAAVETAAIVGNVDLSRYEPDAPNYTPRITSVIDLRKNAPTPFGFSIVRKEPDTDEPIRTTYELIWVTAIRFLHLTVNPTHFLLMKMP
jgi:IMP cyclohydrolase